MPDEPPSPTLDRELTTNIVAAYVRRNQIGADQLPILILTVHQALATVGKPVAEVNSDRTPAVPIRRLFTGTTWFASTAGGAARCSDGISIPAMD
jgi:predicted transcriptional regulator